MPEQKDVNMELIVDNTKKISITKQNLQTILTSLVYCSWNKETSSMTDEDHKEILEVIKMLAACLDDDSSKALMDSVDE